MKHLTVILLSAMIVVAGQAQTAHDQLRKGNAAYKQSNYTDAEAYYRKSLQSKSTVKGSYNLANAMYQQGRYEEAIRRYEHVIENTTDESIKASAYHNLGNAYFEEEEFEKSIEAFKSSLRLRPEDQSTRYNLAQSQRAYKANALFDLAIKLKPQFQQGSTPPQAGEKRVYDITVVNEGKISAIDVGVIDYLPGGLKLDDPDWGEAKVPFFYEYLPGIPRIAPGDSVTISVQLEVVDGSNQEGLMNTVEISKAANGLNKKDRDSSPGNAIVKPDEDDTDSEKGKSGEQQQENQEQDSENQENQQQEQQEQQDQQSQQDQQQNQSEGESEQQEQQPGEEKQDGEKEQPDPQNAQQTEGEKLTAEEARRLLEIIEEEELKVLKKMKKPGGNNPSGKDW